MQLTRPLDFLVVADHSDNMGFFPKLFAGDPAFLADPTGRRWYDMMKSGKGMAATLEIIGAVSNDSFPPALAILPDSKPFSDVWNSTIDAAEAFNDPGRFTAFIGYEWTSQGCLQHPPKRDLPRRRRPCAAGDALHGRAALGSPREQRTWEWMAAYEKSTGGDVLAIAHNGNVATA